MFDDEAEVDCPCCGEPGTVAIDPSGGKRQSFVQDCGVCCRPWQVTVLLGKDGAEVTVEPA